MTKLLLAILFLSAAGSCDAAYKNWTEKERKLYHSYIALSALDTYQAFKMIDCQKLSNCMIHEANPILGSHPQKSEVVMLKVLGNVGIYYMLDRDMIDREKALWWLNATQGLVVAHNGIYWRKRF
jgi:hypothetical protein